MKTPEEIKKGLECSVEVPDGCKGCAFEKRSYDGLVWECTVDVAALAYITQLESRLAQAERERDAAVVDLTKAMSLDGVEDCSFCKNIKKPYCDPCKFEWRGVCEENSK